MNEEEDDISITSTAPSEQRSEYEVETILTEYQFDDGVKYLVKWEGYGIERSTWEPAESFCATETLTDWNKKKKAIAEGKRHEFDLAKFQNHLDSLDREKEDRRKRREAKRRRLGQLSKTPLASLARSPSSNNESPRPASSDVVFKVPGRVSQTNPSTGIAQTNTRPLAKKPPPPILFGSSSSAFSSRPRKTSNSEQGKLFNTLSTRWKYEKAKNYEPAPDISKIELIRPSDWPSKPAGDAVRRSAHNTFSPVDDRPNEISREQNGYASEISALDSPQPSTRPLVDSYRPGRDSPDTWRPIQPAADSQSQTQIGNRRLDLNSATSSQSRGSGQVPDLPSRRPGAKAYYTRDREHWWNPQEVLVDVYYGPDKKEIGPARLCGITGMTKTRLLSSKKEHRIEVWFQHLCNRAEYDFLNTPTKPKWYCYGWIEGFDQTEPNLYNMGEDLRQNQLVAIFDPDNESQNVFLAHSPESQDFKFLSDRSFRCPRNVFVYLAVRNPLRPFDELVTSRRERVSRREWEQPHKESRYAHSRNHPDHNNAPLIDRITHPQTGQCNTEIISDTAITESSIASTAEISTISTQGPAKDSSETEATNENTRESFAPQLQDSPNSKQATAMEKPAPGNLNFDDLSPELLTAFFQHQYSISFEILAKLNAGKVVSAQIFYVMFPADSSVIKTECDFMIKFLKSHDAIVFSNHHNEDWEKFVRTVKTGVVLFHESFVDYYKMPFFRSILNETFNFWNFSLFSPLKFVDRPTHFQRIFPHGGVILIIEDFMIRDSYTTLIILAWFNDYVKKKFPGSWKIMFRPDILNWLLEQPEPNERIRHGQWLAMYSLIMQINARGSGPDRVVGEILSGATDEYTENALISPPRIPQYGSRTEDDNPDIPKGLTQEHRNADHLAEFFAGWALVNCHRYRKFTMLTAVPPLRRWEEWQHVEVKYGAKDFLKSFGIEYKMYWEKVKPTSKGLDSSGEATPQQIPFTPRTPAVGPAIDRLDGAGSGPSYHALPTHNYPQPYQ